MRLFLFLVALIVGARIAVLWFTPTDLFFDEAQYWAWGQEPAFGYFSKPPLIGWIIRATTELAGSIAPFWIRLPAPLFHGATAIILALWMRQMEPRAALAAGLIYLTMPILTIGSWLISTDTIMAPFLAAALWLWWRYLRAPSLTLALFAGLCVGVAMMAKYAGFYFWVGVLVASLHPGLRPRPVHALAALGVCLLVLSPNLLWNLQNGLITFSHTAENVDWVQQDNAIDLNVRGVAAFLGNQLLVIGPIFFLLWFAPIRRLRDADIAYLLAFSLPVLCLVTLQALLSKAYGNWAFAAYLAAAPLVALWITRANRTRLLKAGLALNIALALATTLLILRPGLAPQITARYMGRSDVTQSIINAAKGRAILATDRELLADLTHAAAKTRTQIFAPIPQGPPHNYYEMTKAWDGITPVFLVTRAANACATTPQLSLTPTDGAYKGATISAYLTDSTCQP